MSHISDVAGLRVGHASDFCARTGTTAIVFDRPAVCGVSVLGGAPGTVETDALRPGNLCPAVDAVTLSGGSAFGIAAAAGAQRALHQAGRGFQVGPHRVPIVPGAVVFDLGGPPPDYAALGERAATAALTGTDRTIGTVGAGVGATTARLKGGVGSAAEAVGDDTVGALVVVNAVGAVTAANGPWFRAAPFERNGEFGNLATAPQADFATVNTKLDATLGANTTIALIATDRTLDVAAATRLARSAHDGLVLSIWPSHTLFDGDTVFAASTATTPARADPLDQMALVTAASRALARAVARAVYAAEAFEGDRFPTWQALYGST
ncbi:MAG: P1 family peptidase [Pseudomonadota bacterium]